MMGGSLKPNPAFEKALKRWENLLRRRSDGLQRLPHKGDGVLTQGKPDGKEIHPHGKNELCEAIDKGQTAFKEADQ